MICERRDVFEIQRVCVCVLCLSKLGKLYNDNNEEDDMNEMEEERLRMKEHVMNEVSDIITERIWKLSLHGPSKSEHWLFNFKFDHGRKDQYTPRAPGQTQ